MGIFGQNSGSDGGGFKKFRNGKFCNPFQIDWRELCRLCNLEAGLEQLLGVDAMRAELGLRLFSVIADSTVDGYWKDIALSSTSWSLNSGAFPSELEGSTEPAPAVSLSCCARTPGSGAEGNEFCGFPTATNREAMRRKRKIAMRRK